MAKEQKPSDQFSGIAEQAMEQARRAGDIYFDYIKQAIAATPSAGNEFAEKLKEYAEKNITATQEFLRKLSQARNFQDVVRVQKSSHPNSCSLRSNPEDARGGGRKVVSRIGEDDCLLLEHLSPI